MCSQLWPALWYSGTQQKHRDHSHLYFSHRRTLQYWCEFSCMDAHLWNRMSQSVLFCCFIFSLVFVLVGANGGGCCLWRSRDELTSRSGHFYFPTQETLCVLLAARWPVLKVKVLSLKVWVSRQKLVPLNLSCFASSSLQDDSNPSSLLLDFGDVTLNRAVTKRLLITNQTAIPAPFSIEAEYFTCPALMPNKSEKRYDS